MSSDTKTVYIKWKPTRVPWVAVLELARLGACSYCILRFVECRHEPLYWLSEPELIDRMCMPPPISEISGANEDQKQTEYEETCNILNKLREYLLNRSACVVCLDLLVPNPNLYNSVKRYAEKEDYQFDEFAVFRTVPASLVIRQFGMWLHLHSLFKDTKVPGCVMASPFVSRTYDNRIVDLKEALKWTHTRNFAACLALEGRGDREMVQFRKLVEEQSRQIHETERSGNKSDTELRKPFSPDAQFRLHSIYLTELMGSETKLRQALSSHTDTAAQKPWKKGRGSKPGQMEGSALSGNNLVKLLPRLTEEILSSVGLCPPKLPSAPITNDSLISVSAPPQSDQYFSVKKQNVSSNKVEAANYAPNADELTHDGIGVKRERKETNTESEGNTTDLQTDSESKRVRQLASDSTTSQGENEPVQSQESKSSLDAIPAAEVIHKPSPNSGYEAFHEAVFERDEQRPSLPQSWDVRNISVVSIMNFNSSLKNISKCPIETERIEEGSKVVVRDWYECPKPKSVNIWALEGAGNNSRSIVLQVSPYLCMELFVSHANVLLEGNYMKLSRVLSQTQWNVGFGNDTSSNSTPGGKGSEEESGSQIQGPDESKQAEEYNKAQNDDNDDSGPLAESSVENELTKSIAHLYSPTNGFKFHASGREDLNVRMLGTGRPFFVEFCDPKRIPENTLETYQKMTDLIHSGSQVVKVFNLRKGTSSSFDAMTRGIGEKRKSYRCVVYCTRPLNGPEELDCLNRLCDGAPNGEVEVSQATPTRVLFRRTATIRKRTISNLSARYINSNWFYLDLETQAGTYVKEFVHSDRGRCTPSVSELLNAQCTIIQLDVTNLIM